MSIYLITYHLREDNENCGCGNDEHHHHNDANLIRKIKSLGAWAHFMPSSFLIHTSMNINELLKDLKSIVSEKDLIFVSKIDSKTSASLTPEVLDWIEKKENN
ncbi:hypothetical protein [Clostridium tarantellae]|uniref:SinR family protein n=1 Tax=Clostridium tarantellae TaxID=39493 RepID=A0A6I1MP50_9CLOT|nr:hypothetical protein [Clostridium tarantellae]MPQ44710.1 hypothetical protein [Clostridium tarantellae]